MTVRRPLSIDRHPSESRSLPGWSATGRDRVTSYFAGMVGAATPGGPRLRGGCAFRFVAERKA